MVSTYLSYNLVARDLSAAMKHTASETVVKREADYFNANIGSVRSAEDFVDNYRLYSYAMKAYGLEDMTYAKAFMLKVLNSDLSDSSSFANQLTDNRYRAFAAAFQFSSATNTPMSAQQIDDAIGLYDQSIASLDDTISKETAYYNAKASSITSVDAFLSDDRLRNYAFQAFGINPNTYDRTFIRNLLTSNTDDPSSYYNSTLVPTLESTQSDIESRRTLLSQIATRQSLVSAQTNYQTLSDTISDLQVQLLAAGASLLEIGADTQAIQTTIDGLNQSIHSKFASFDQAALDDLNAQRTALVDTGVTSGAEIDALDAQISNFTSDLDARNAIVTAYQTITANQAAMSEPDADVIALTQSIADQRAAILTSGSALTTGLTDIASAISVKTTQIDAYSSTLPALGAETTALKTKLTTEITKLATYFNSVEKYLVLVDAYRFNGDGSVPPEGFQNQSELTATNELYASNQDRLTRTGALLNDDYFRQNVNNFTSAGDMLSDSRMVKYIKDAFGLSSYATIVTSTIENALTTPATDADLADPSNYLTRFYKGKPYYDDLVAMARAFNFNSDGSLDDGVSPIDEGKIDTISNQYFSRYDDVDAANDEKAISQIKAELSALTSTHGKDMTVDDLLASKTIYNFVMKAVGIDPDTVPARTIKKVLTSDLQDPKSLANSLKDDRYVKLANLFNFGTDGKLSARMTAQDLGTAQQIAKDYVILKSRFDATDAVKEKAQKDANAYIEKVTGIKSLSALLDNRTIIDFALEAKGIDPKTVSDDMLKQSFHSDLSDPKSYVNTLQDYRMAEVVASFNFDSSGTMVRTSATAMSNRAAILETANLYLRQTIESEQGAENEGVRLALYFERSAPDIKSAYDILGDQALYAVFKTAFSLPDEIGGMDVDQQAALIEKKLNLEDLADPEKLARFVQRFTALYDLENGSTASSPLSVLTSNGSATINFDTLVSLSQLRGAR